MQPKPPPATHSPLPWHKAEYGTFFAIKHGATTIARFEREQDCDLAIAACNSQAKLVEALKSHPSLPFIEDMTADQMADKLREISAWMDNEALAAAGEA